MAELVFYFTAGILEKHLELSQLQTGESQHLPLHVKACHSIHPLVYIFSVSLLPPHHMWHVGCAASPSCFLPQGCCELESDVC